VDVLADGTLFDEAFDVAAHMWPFDHRVEARESAGESEVTSERM
jgi:hypothetical protein